MTRAQVLYAMVTTVVVVLLVALLLGFITATHLVLDALVDQVVRMTT